MPDETPDVERLRSWCAMLEEANAAWQSENDKLRELCRDFYAALDRMCDQRMECITCMLNDDDCSECDACRLNERARELGVEVDE